MQGHAGHGTVLMSADARRHRTARPIDSRGRPVVGWLKGGRLLVLDFQATFSP